MWNFKYGEPIKLSFIMFTLDEHFFSTENLQIFTCVLFLLSIRSVWSDNSYDWWGQCHVTLYLVVFLNAAIHTRTRVLWFKFKFWFYILPLLKVMYTKYSKHWLYTVAHTIECVCSKMNNSWFNPWFLFYFSSLYPAPYIEWYMC